MVSSFRDVIAACGGVTAMAQSVGAKPASVEKWRQRDRIPSDYWKAAIEAAAERGEMISADELARMAAKPIDSQAAASTAEASA